MGGGGSRLLLSPSARLWSTVTGLVFVEEFGRVTMYLSDVCYDLSFHRALTTTGTSSDSLRHYIK